MFLNSIAMLTGVIQKEPGVIVGPITKFLGHILNFLFNIASQMSESYSLGLSIILLTIITRTLMLPISFKQQKSMFGMQRLQPEMEKIKAKYGTSKDPEIQKKINTEIQQLYAKNKVNPLSGCLPLFITFPIFIALSYLMNQTYMFIDKLGDIYYVIAKNILDLKELRYEEYANVINAINPLILNSNMVPKNLMPFDFAASPENFMKCLNLFSTSMWDTLMKTSPADIQNTLAPILAQKQNIEHFLGVNLVEVSGWGFPGILIPVLSGLTTFFSTWVMMRKTKPTDANAQMQQKIMLIVMPIMMGFMTVNLPAGVGVYWITSGLYQMIQQPLINKYYENKLGAIAK